MADITLNNRITAATGLKSATTSVAVSAATAPTSGQVLTATASTTATWQTPAVGSGQTIYVAKTANYTATISDYTIDCTSGTFTVTLPTAVGITGRIYVIKNSGTGVITVATTSSQTIDGGLTATLSTQYESITVVSNGSNWIIT